MWNEIFWHSIDSVLILMLLFGWWNWFENVNNKEEWKTDFDKISVSSAWSLDMIINKSCYPKIMQIQTVPSRSLVVVLNSGFICNFELNYLEVNSYFWLEYSSQSNAKTWPKLNNYSIAW